MNKKRNILFILSDQHNAGVLGAAGDKTVRTPSLDRLASEGVRFDQAYCQNPLCVPSRYSMLTGRHSRNIGIYTNNDILMPNSTTIPRVLSAHGYRTCLIGKAHFNGEQFHGYQQRPYGDLYGQAHQPDPFREKGGEESGLGEFLDNSGATGIPLPMTQTEICVAEAAKWLQTHCSLHSDQPFFLSVNFDKPHFPVRCPSQYFARYDGRLRVPEVPEGARERAVPFVRRAMDRFGFEGQDGDRYLAAYYGCVEWMDDAIGRLMHVLEHLGMAEDTLVVYTSDHGDLCGEKGVWNKSLFFDSSARVPLIVRCPSLIPPRPAESSPVGLIDLFPTLCDAADVPVPESCEGLSLLPLLTGESGPPRDRVYCETSFLWEPSDAGCMVRTGQWKYSLYLDGSQELYNMEEDPGEWNNLADDPTLHDLVGELRADVRRFWEPEQYADRLASAPKVDQAKHCYFYSNQFIVGDGAVADARP